MTNDTPQPHPAFAARVNRNIKAELARNDVPSSYLEGALNLHRASIDRRRNGSLEWSLSEIEIIASIVNVDPSALTRRTSPGPE